MSIAAQPRVLLVGIHAPYNRTNSIESYYQEFLSLIDTLGVQYEDAVFIKLRSVETGTLLTKGKLEELFQLCEKENIDRIFISEPLTPQQERNLEDYLHVEVVDRTQLILNIFDASAHTAEGKVQVEIAQLAHLKTRLTGKGAFLSQQRGVIGLKAGSGETLKEKETRVIDQRVSKLKRDLERINKTRQTQRERRLERRIAHVCLVGYTNSGKSSMLNALTKSNVLAQDKLFATLDTTTREIYIDSKKIGIISDTVGFIQMLPPQLIEAFKSTLQELHYADLLLHIIDISDVNWQEHNAVVQDILKELDVDKPMIYVFNKSDKVELTPELINQMSNYQPFVVTSTLTPEGVQELKDALVAWSVATTKV